MNKSGKYDTVDQKLSFGNDILKIINFQVRDLDLQAMGGCGDGTEKNFGPVSKVPKSVTHVTRGRTDSSYLSISILCKELLSREGIERF